MERKRRTPGWWLFALVLLGLVLGAGGHLDAHEDGGDCHACHFSADRIAPVVEIALVEPVSVGRALHRLEATPWGPHRDAASPRGPPANA